MATTTTQERINGLAAQKGELAGRTDGILRRSHDPRGRFIGATILPESSWKSYQEAYEKAYLKQVRPGS